MRIQWQKVGASVIFLSAAIMACSSEPKQTPDDGLIIIVPDASMDIPDDATMEDMVDMSVNEAEEACRKRGMPYDPWQPGGVGRIGEVAGDFTVQTRKGPWRLSEQWSGCDSYLFLMHTNNNQGNALWQTQSLLGLFSNAAPNTHFFFGANASSSAEVSPRLDTIVQKVDSALSFLGKQSQWADRVHYITEPIQQTPGALGVALKGQLRLFNGIGIDRMQRFDDVGSLASIGAGGFVADLNMAAFLSHYYNHQRNLHHQLQSESDVTVVSLMDAQQVEQNNQLYTTTFPDAQTMSQFNTMQVEVVAQCGPGPQDCGEWDYEAFVELCLDEMCEKRQQIILWITPYSRPGTRRWVVDATPFLGLLKDGGEKTFRYGMLWNMNPNRMTINFRLSSTPDEPRPIQTLPAFGGGEFNESYNADRMPLSFMAPASFKRAELVVLLTGHGQTQGNNCAEWCNHAHHFSFNGSEALVRDFPGQAGASLACAKQSAQGVVPGQYGNWTPGRAAWCPGQIVKPWRVDVTEQIKAGEQNTLQYEGKFNGGAPQGGRIRMSSFVVFYD